MNGLHRVCPMLLAMLVLAGCQASSSLVPSGQSPYGTWEGLLPCADCPGILMQLQLWKQPSVYRLTQTYQSAATSPRTFVGEGHWRRVPRQNEDSLGMIVLQPKAKDGEVSPPEQFFSQLPDGSLRKLDAQGRPIKSTLNYRLRRIRAPGP